MTTARTTAPTRTDGSGGAGAKTGERTFASEATARLMGALARQVKARTQAADCRASQTNPLSEIERCSRLVRDRVRRRTVIAATGMSTKTGAP